MIAVLLLNKCGWNACKLMLKCWVCNQGDLGFNKGDVLIVTDASTDWWEVCSLSLYCSVTILFSESTELSLCLITVLSLVFVDSTSAVSS